MNRKTFFNILKFSIFLGIGVLLIWVITKDLTEEQKHELFDSFRNANYWWVGLSVLIGILSHILRALRWKMMMEPMGYHPRLKTTFYSVMIAYLANMALPRLGEITRCGIMQRYEKVPFDKGIGTIVVERAIDLLSLILVTILLFITQFTVIYGFFDEKVITPIAKKLHDGSGLLIWIIAIGMILFALMWFLIRRFRHTEMYVRLRIMFMNVRDGMYSIRHLNKPWLFVFYSVFIWVCYFSMVLVCFYALEQTAHFGPAQALTVLVFGTVGIISTPGGIGAYHLIVTETLVALYALDKSYAISYSWLAWSCQTLMIIFIGVLSLLFLARLKQKELPDAQV